jgi:hypothetical protein
MFLASGYYHNSGVEIGLGAVIVIILIFGCIMYMQRKRSR